MDYDLVPTVSILSGGARQTQTPDDEPTQTHSRKQNGHCERTHRPRDHALWWCRERTRDGLRPRADGMTFCRVKIAPEQASAQNVYPKERDTSFPRCVPTPPKPPIPQEDATLKYSVIWGAPKTDLSEYFSDGARTDLQTRAVCPSQNSASERTQLLHGAHPRTPATRPGRQMAAGRLLAPAPGQQNRSKRKRPPRPRDCIPPR